MRLKVHQENQNKHTDTVTCVGWTGNNELFSCGDDRKLHKWTGDGEFIGAVPAAIFDSPPPASKQANNVSTPSPSYVSDLQWLPTAPGKGQTVADLYAAGGTDGKFYLCSKGGRIEKIVEAHKGALLALKWNYEGSAIVTAGEDGQAKIWSREWNAKIGYPIYSVVWSPDNDQILYTNGRNLPNQWKGHDGVILKVDWNFLYSSSIHDHPITSLAWNPFGEIFAVGSFNMLRVCDKLGWSCAVAKPQCGSIFGAAWTPDGTQIACAGGNGAVVFGHVTLIDDRKIKVHERQCYVYSDKNWNTPAIIDLTNNGRVICIKQTFSFAVVDNYTGIQIFTYEGRTVSHPKYPGLPLSNDSVYVFEVASGRQIGDNPIRAPTDILEISLNQVSAPSSGTMVETVSWNDEADMFAAMVDGKFVVWYYPNVVFIDEDIEPITRFEKDGSQFGKNAQFVNFIGTQCTVRRADGALVTVNNISPLPAMLQDISKRKHWEEAIRICRYAKMKELWACLAAMAVAGQDLNTAELAYAAIDEVQKVQYICHIREIPTTEGRSAELALLRKQPKEAEAILISGGLIYRAIRMWINLFNWDRALEIAVKYKTHVDTVLYFRDKYLQGMNRKETIKQFLQYGQTVTFSWDKIKSKIAMEEESERSKPSAKPYHA
ncbi:WD40-repeat-containing domain protein [Chytridium lagenaria]|nr:WD40-repeat-containing domain protein [Chytridium lagenaria]